MVSVNILDDTLPAGTCGASCRRPVTDRGCAPSAERVAMDQMCRGRTHDARTPVSRDVNGTTRTQMPADGPGLDNAGLDTGILDSAALDLVDRWWRAANYVSVGQIYLRSNPLLREPLRAEHTKSRLLGHWGTTPGLNFVYAHLNRAIRRDSQKMLFIAGPGHGGPAVVANAWLEGTYSEIYGHVGDDEAGLSELFRQFSYPGGIPSHAAPETPGSISEGGELGYSLAHAYGSVFDNPDLITAVVIGDGEAETGPLAASWHSHNFLNPAADGAVLPILHLNGYKIANPTILARMPETQLEQLLRGYGHVPHFVTVADPADTAAAHRDFAGAVADDRAAFAQGLDRAQDGGREAGGGHLAQPPGPAERSPHQPWAPEPAAAVARVLPAGGTLRRPRTPEAGDGQERPGRGAADERNPPCQRRDPAAPAQPAGLPPARRRRRRTRHQKDQPHGDARPLAARRHCAEPRDLPALRPRRDGIEPAAGRLRGHRQGLAVQD